MTNLTQDGIMAEIDRVLAALDKDACRSCECYLAYLTQLEMDADEDARGLIEAYGAQGQAVHSCLGCDPCPPSDHFAAYLRRGRDGTCCGGV